jgi:hypothetical protein
VLILFFSKHNQKSKMATRGRKSTAALAAVALATPVTATQRLIPARHLSDAEQSVWAEVVNDQPAGAFTATHAPLLEMYCRHVVQSRILSDEVSNFERAWLAEDEGLERFDKLLKMAERETRAASSLATRLRITRQAIDQQTIARSQINAPKGRKPWEMALA